MTDAARPRVLIVDDNPSLRLTLSTLLNTNGFNVVGEAENGAVGERAFAELNPDLTLLDVSMPQESGLEALKGIMTKDPEACVVMLTSVHQLDVLDDAIRSGAREYIHKDSPADELVNRLKEIVG